MKTQKIKLPYGISNFKRMILDSYYYVDKTKYIEQFEACSEPYIFFLRPRRFGKSLFIYQLRYYYGIEYKDIFNKIFGDCYIDQNPTSKANKYHVLHFEFSRIDTITDVSKAGEKNLKNKTDKAVAQVKEYLQFEEIGSLKNIKAYVLIFVGSETKVIKEIA